MKIQLKQNQLKEYRQSAECGLREFSRITNISTTTLLKIERGEMVNMRLINTYLNGLTTLTNNIFMFIFEQKTTQKD